MSGPKNAYDRFLDIALPIVGIVTLVVLLFGMAQCATQGKTEYYEEPRWESPRKNV
jgi:hypothetical protein